MEILNGLFRSPCSFLTKDNHGGCVFDVYSYIYIYIYDGKIKHFGITGYSMDFDDTKTLQEFFDKLVAGAKYDIEKEITENSINVIFNSGVSIYGTIQEEGIKLNISAKDEEGNVLFENRIFEKREILEILQKK